MAYLFETHYHTPLTSHCGSVAAADALPKYIEAGYDGIFVTDHYYKDWFYEDRFAGMSWAEKMNVWLDGYRSVVAAAEGTGLTVILGLELRFTDNMNDHLVYGVDEQFLIDHPELYNMTCSQFHDFADKHGLFFAQAHPFRVMCSRRDPKDLHGVEVFNGNKRHNSRNDDAEQFARDHGLVMISGSDFHEWEDLAMGGIYLEKKPRDSKELAAMLLRGEVADLKRG